MEDFDTVNEKMAEHIPADGKWGMVLYSDGGYRSTLDHSGWGLHGYIYDHVEKKTGYGLKRCEPTTAGYVGPGIRQVDAKGKALRIRLKNGMEGEKVRVTHYIDAYGNDPDGVRPTNNSAELSGLYHALQIIDKHKPPVAQLVLDSEYVLKGCLNWRIKWKASGWKKPSGEEIASKELWLKTDGLLESLAKQPISISWDWAKGHMDDIGNNMADEWAGKVMNGLGNGAQIKGMKLSPTAKYWSPKSDIHPLLKDPRVYLNVQSVRPTSQIDGAVYHFGNNPGAGIILGETSAQKGYSVIAIPAPDKVLESVRDYYVKTCVKNPYVIVLEVKNDLLCTPKTHNDIFEYGYLHLRSSSNANVKNVHHNDLAVPADPPMLLINALGHLEKMETFLAEYLSGKLDGTEYIETDITDSLYDRTESKKGEVLKVKRDNLGHVKVAARINNGSELDDKTVPLTYGVDLPRHSILSSVAHLEPSIKLFTWADSEITFRYLTILTCKAGAGIWCGVYSNIAFMKTLAITSKAGSHVK